MSTFTDSELSLLLKYFNLSINYLEFGCGESTILASRCNNIKKIISFDSSIIWINDIINQLNNSSRCKLIHLDIGEVKKWGYPINNNPINSINYSLKFIQYLPNNLLYDLIFIDGRYRVATSLLSSLFLDNYGYIMIHDYFNREHYSFIELFFNKVESSDSLFIFNKKENLNINQLLTYFSIYSTDPR